MGKNIKNLDISPEEQMNLMIELAMGTPMNVNLEDQNDGTKSSTESSKINNDDDNRESVHDDYSQSYDSNNKPSLFDYSKKSSSKKKNKKVPKKYRELCEFMQPVDKNSRAFDMDDDTFNDPSDIEKLGESIAKSMVNSTTKESEGTQYYRDDDGSEKMADMIVHAMSKQFEESSDTEESETDEPVSVSPLLVYDDKHIYFENINDKDDEGFIQREYVNRPTIDILKCLVYSIAETAIIYDDDPRELANFASRLLSSLCDISIDIEKREEAKEIDRDNESKENDEDNPGEIDDLEDKDDIPDDEDENAGLNIRTFGEKIKIPDTVRNAISNPTPVETNVET